MTTTDFSTRVASSFRCAHGVLAALAAALVFLPSIAAAQQVSLGTAANFGVLAATAVTNTGPSGVNGNVGVSPGTAVVGFPPGTFTGTLHTGNAVALQAQTDLTAGFNTATMKACGFNLVNPELGGLTLTPGVYCFAAGAGLTGALTLDFQGNPNAEFLFKTASSLVTASGSNVVAVNTGGATCLPNLNWQVGSSATLGTNSNFAGNILAQSSITLTTGANLRGRALARTAAVTLDSNGSVGGCPIAAGSVGGPVPGVGGSGVQAVPTLQEWSLVLLALALAAAGARYARRRGHPAARR